MTDMTDAPIQTEIDDNIASRRAALHILEHVLDRKQSLDDGIDAYCAELDAQDRRFTHALLGEVFRNISGLDRAINAMLERPVKSMRTRHILRIGLAQLFLLKSVPPFAAINTSVNLAKAEALENMASLINALLRRASRDKPTIELSPADELPKWLAEKLRLDYGQDIDHLAQSMYERAPLYARARDSETEDAFEAIHAQRLAGIYGCWEMPPAVAASTVPGLQKGTSYVQDGAAQVPAMAVAAHLKIDGDVLDLCAAPGGKTAQLMDLLPERTVHAVDNSARRLATLKENMTRMGLSPIVTEADGTQLPYGDNTFAAVLLDAPCSAIGTTRRHPELVHIRQEQDLESLALLQRDMLKEAFRVLKPGGVLVYAVCSLLMAEGERRTDKFVAKTNGVRRIMLDLDTVSLAHKADNGALRLFPTDAVDGFYIAAFTKE